MHAREVDLTRMREQRERRRGLATAYPTRGSTALVPEQPPERSPEPNRRSVPRLRVAPPPPVPVPRAPFVVLVLLVVAGGVLGILLLNTKVNENAFILHDLRQEQAVLDQHQQELEQEIARADTPAQLEAEARRLGLVKAEELAYLRLPGGELVREPMPASGVPAPGTLGSEGPGTEGSGTEGSGTEGAGDGATEASEG
jgi:cell division protein FtsB